MSDERGLASLSLSSLVERIGRRAKEIIRTTKVVLDAVGSADPARPLIFGGGRVDHGADLGDTVRGEAGGFGVLADEVFARRAVDAVDACRR